MYIAIYVYMHMHMYIAKYNILIDTYLFKKTKKNTNKHDIQNAYESSIIFQPFYMPMFLPNLRLMRPLSLKKVSLMIPSLFEIFHLNGIVTNMRDAA